MVTFSEIKKYTIGEKFEPKKPTFSMVKSSIFCAPRGFLIFLLAGISAANSAYLGDEERKKEALYAMYHNVFPFLEVTCLMIPIMFVMHTKTNLATPFVCLAAAFVLCMSLRILGIRKDCCDDINYAKDVIFSKEGVFQNFSFIIPPDNEEVSGTEKVCHSDQNNQKKKDNNIPSFCRSIKKETYGEIKRGKIHSFCFKLICSLLILPLLVIKILDLIVRSVIDVFSYPLRKAFFHEREQEMVFNKDTKKIASIEISCFFLFLLSDISCCEEKFGKSFNTFSVEPVGGCYSLS